MVENKNSRIQWIDALRALALLFVMIGHLIPDNNAYFIFTSPIKIPLFFAISGYLFNDRKGDIKKFFKNIFIKIIIPWLTIAGLIYFASSIFKGYIYFFESMWSVIKGDILWYMPCFIVAETIFFIFYRCSKSIIALSSICCVLCTIGYILSEFNILNIFMINRALVAQLFLLIGSLIKKHQKILSASVLMICSSFIYILMCFVWFIFFPNMCIDIHLNQYCNVIYSFILIILGCISVFSLFSKISRYPTFIVKLGENSLFIYITHSYVYAWFNTLQSRFFGVVNINFVTVIIYVVLTCLICTFFSIIFNKVLSKINNMISSKKSTDIT